MRTPSQEQLHGAIYWRVDILKWVNSILDGHGTVVGEDYSITSRVDGNGSSLKKCGMHILVYKGSIVIKSFLRHWKAM